MANCYIDFSCTQQDLQRTDARTVAEGASVLFARFELCPKWDGLTVYARFRHGAACYDVELQDGAALIPWEVVAYTGLEVSVWGEDAEGGRLTSRAVFVPVERTISLDTCEPIPSSPTLIGAFTEQVTAAAEAARRAQEANAATVEVGAVETGEPGTPANVWNSGTNMDAVLNFTLPRGEKGDGLPEGGNAGQIMTKTETGAVWADAPETGAAVDFPVSVFQGGTGATNAEAARANLDVYSKAEVDALNIGGGGSGGGGDVATVELVTKAGIIQPYSGAELPEGFLWCDGAAYSRTAYAQLFAAIGTTFGAGDGLTTFNVPDMRGRVPVGAGDGYSVGATGGEAEHTLTEPEMPSHDHVTSVTNKLHEAGNTDGYLVTGSYSVTATTSVRSEGGDQPHNNMQPYTVVNYVISTGVSSFTEFVPVANGGTGANTAAGAREALGITRENLGVTLENLGAADYIVAEGTNGIWDWQKWASGRANCCCRINFANLTCDGEWGGMYYTASQYVGDYPFEFTKSPAVFTNLIGGRDGTTVLYGYGSATQPPKVYLLRPDKVTTAFELACSFKAEGRWK